MPSTQALRQRIKSVRSTRQITKAMELVSAAKMRRANEAVLAARPYARRALGVISDILGHTEEALNHPLLQPRAKKNVLILAIASDRSLAGSHNSNIGKQALTAMKHAERQGYSVNFIAMGKQISQTLSRLGATIIQSYPHSNQPESATLLPISRFLTKAFLDGTYSHVEVIYTDFQSLLVQEAKTELLLPLAATEVSTSKTSSRFFSYEPSTQVVLDAVLPRLVEARLVQFVQESTASEHAARRLAMQNASSNAGDMIDDLTLTYNGIRQGSITRELAEITGGAAAIETSL